MTEAEDLHDVFLCLPGTDRHDADHLYAALVAEGLRVFMDDPSIGVHESISGEIERALGGSRLLVAYYSVGFTQRYACQQELITAFLAGLAEGDAARRVLVVNPEPAEDHLAPIELADARFARFPLRRVLTAGHLRDADRAQVQEVAARIAERVRQVRTPLGAVRLVGSTRWVSRDPAGVQGFTGRYHQLWQLHSGLHSVDYPMSRPSGLPVVTVCGLPGIGKTALVRTYATLFAAAYPGGVHWTSLAGSDAASLRTRYADELRWVGDRIGIDTAGLAGTEDLLWAVADRLSAGAPALWVVDDVPTGLDADTLVGLAPPHPSVRTVLVTREPGEVRSLSLGRLDRDEGVQLLAGYRLTDPRDADDLQACRELVDLVDGHPLVLKALGARLRDSVRTYRAAVDDLLGSGAPAGMTQALADVVDGIGPVEKLVLLLGGCCAPAPLPDDLIEAVLTGPTTPAALDEALHGLGRRQLATRVEGGWQIHRLVTSVLLTDDPSTAGQLAHRAAETILHRLRSRSERAPAFLLPHADALARRPTLPAAPAEGLLRELCAHHDGLGETSLTVPYRLRLAHTDEDVLALAEALLAAGEAERVLTLLASRGDPQAGTLIARALDTLGRYDHAATVWGEALSRLPSGDAKARLSHARHLRLAGRSDLAREAAEGLLDTPGDVGQAAKLELARTLAETYDQRRARQLAWDVAEHYAGQGRPGHALCREALQAAAEAQLTLYLTELQPDTAAWGRAERELAHQITEQRERYGLHHPATLATSIAHGFALVSVGKPRRARDAIAGTRTAVGERLGIRHPLWLRATFLLGQALAQIQDPGARTLFEEAYAGQLTALGPTHRETLMSQYSLGVALILDGHDRRRGLALVGEVRRLAPGSVGLRTDLAMQARAAAALGMLPSPVWRLVNRKTSRTTDRDDYV